MIQDWDSSLFCTLCNRYFRKQSGLTYHRRVKHPSTHHLIPNLPQPASNVLSNETKVGTHSGMSGDREVLDYARFTEPKDDANVDAPSLHTDHSEDAGFDIYRENTPGFLGDDGSSDLDAAVENMGISSTNRR